jgi:hypothetical protein
MRSLRVSQSRCNHSFAKIKWALSVKLMAICSVTYCRILYLRKSHFHVYSSDVIYFKNSVYYLTIPVFLLRSFYAHSCSHENYLLYSSFLSISLSVRPCVHILTVQLPLDRFMWHFPLGTSWKSVKYFQIWLESGRNIRPCEWRPMCVLFFHATLNHHKSTPFKWSVIWLLV